jgi:energy-coupling factor transporter ATP-binding protein EcfA2
MFIEQLKLLSFKGFSDFTLNLLPFTCLVGLNSKGKTSVLQAIGLLHDIFVFAFGARERPGFVNPQWDSDPSYGLNRMSFGDPDAVWLHKRTSESCKISATFSGQVEVILEIAGRNRYKLDVNIAGNSIKEQIAQPANRQVIEDIFALRPTYVPPVGAVSPSEDFIVYPILKERLDRGRQSECWRSHLYWLWNDGDKTSFDDIVHLVQQYLPEAKILPPRMTHEHPPKVLVEFEEEGTTFDVSASGGGMRTLLNLAAALHFLQSGCILCDEPDSHLHSTLQRAVARMLLDFSEENGRQVIVASHAPDFIAEVPVQSLVWIDRSQTAGVRCNQLGQVLVDLGAIAKADAVRACGADKILLVEGGLDQEVLRRLMALARKRDLWLDAKVLIAKLPSGKGDKAHLRVFRDLLRETLRMDPMIACVTDNDYELANAAVSGNQDDDGPLVLAIGRKEVENYLLDPPVIATAAAAAAARRRTARTGEPVTAPDVSQVKETSAAIMQDDEIKARVKYQVVWRYRQSLSSKLDEATRGRQADEWFDERWRQEEWRTNNCPGKLVLRKLREWCQSQFGLTLTDKLLIENLPACPQDIADIATRLDAYFYGSRTGE